MRRTNRRQGPLCAWILAVAVVGAAAIGCGETDSSPSVAEAPEPRGYVAFASHLVQLLVEADEEACERLDRIDRRSLDRVRCPPPAPLRKGLKTFEILAAAPYEDVGLVYYISHGTGQLSGMILVQGSDRRWSVERLKIAAGLEAGNGAGAGAASADAALGRYERAVRARDCGALVRLTYRLADAPAPSCDDQLAKTRRLARALDAHPEQRPAFIGRDPNYAFYALKTLERPPVRYVFTTIRAHVNGRDRYFVLDLFDTSSGAA